MDDLIKPRRIRPALIALLLATAAVDALMIRDWLRNPHDPATFDYGSNHEGALVQGLAATTIELAVLLATLRPWAGRAGVGRVAFALLLFAPWAWWNFMHSIHAGGVVLVHTLWCLLICLGLVVAFVSGLVGDGRGQ